MRIQFPSSFVGYAKDAARRTSIFACILYICIFVFALAWDLKKLIFHVILFHKMLLLGLVYLKTKDSINICTFCLQQGKIQFIVVKFNLFNYAGTLELTEKNSSVLITTWSIIFFLFSFVFCFCFESAMRWSYCSLIWSKQS